jgi:hypothetical protein
MGFLNETNDVLVARTDEDDNGDIESLSHQSSEHNSNSTSDFSRKTSGGSSKEALIDIARKEQRNVRVIRIITFAAVIMCAISVSALVYYFATGSDTSNFELEVRTSPGNLYQDILYIW